MQKVTDQKHFPGVIGVPLQFFSLPLSLGKVKTDQNDKDASFVFTVRNRKPIALPISV